MVVVAEKDLEKLVDYRKTASFKQKVAAAYRRYALVIEGCKETCDAHEWD